MGHLLSEPHNDAFDEIELMADLPEEQLISFGNVYLDDALGGIASTDVVVLSARTGEGKTELATHIAASACKQGKKVTYLGLESDPCEIRMRMVYKAMVHLRMNDVNRMQGWFDYQDWLYRKKRELWRPYHKKAVQLVREKMVNLEIYRKGESFNADDLCLEFTKRKGVTDLFVLDHLHYVDLNEKDSVRAMATLVETVGHLAREHRLPIILVAHLRKSQMYQPTLLPSLDDLHGSSEIKKTATKIVFIGADKTDKATKGAVLIHAAKNRRRGSVTWNTAKMLYNFQKNAYSTNYQLVKMKANGMSYEPLGVGEQEPWAVNWNWSAAATEEKTKKPKNYAPPYKD